jgi:hypothetical protein
MSASVTLTQISNFSSALNSSMTSTTMSLTSSLYGISFNRGNITGKNRLNRALTDTCTKEISPKKIGTKDIGIQEYQK